MSSELEKSPSPTSDPNSAQEEYEEEPSEIQPSSEQNDEEKSNGSPLEKTTSKASVNNLAAVPNGGLRAWLQVLGAFILFFNTWGIINTFGAYQTFYENGTLFKESSSTISWIGAIQAFLLMLVGALTGPIYDAGHFRKLLWCGSVLVVFGQMMLSLCQEYWQVLLAQAFCIGLGAGLLFVPSVAILSTYFSTKIAFAIGIAASGSSMGGVIYPIVFYRLQPTIGFAWTTRVIGFIMLGTFLVPLTVMKVRVLPAQKRKLFDFAALTEAPFMLYTIGAMIGFMGLYVPFFYIQFYAIRSGAMAPNLAFYQLAILNSASVFGRILPNFVADKTGPFNMLIPCAFFSGMLILCLLAISQAPGIMAFAAFYGFFSGTFVSLPPSIYVSLSPSRGIIGTRMGMGFTIVSLGVLTGTPAAGAVLGAGEHLNFTGLWIFGGVLVLSGACLMTAARFCKEPKLIGKV